MTYETVAELPPVKNDPQRRRYETALNSRLPNRLDRDEVLTRAHGGPKIDRFDMWPIETLQRAAEVELPAFLAEKAAQAAEDKAREKRLARHQHRDRLERVKAAIFSGLRVTDRGEPATPEVLAQAQAEADAEAAHEALAVKGGQARLKSAGELAKAQGKAIAKAKANPPVEPTELDELEAKAIAAIDELRVALRSYAKQIDAVRRDFAEAGVVAQGGNVSQDGIDWGNHWHADANAVTIDGVLYDVNTAADRRFARVAQRAVPVLAQAGAAKFMKRVSL